MASRGPEDVRAGTPDGAPKVRRDHNESPGTQGTAPSGSSEAPGTRALRSRYRAWTQRVRDRWNTGHG